MLITEVVKSFLDRPLVDKEKNSSNVEPENVLNSLADEDKFYGSGAFFDSDSTNTLFNSKSHFQEVLFKQKEKILTYRNISKNPDVDSAIEEIVNEIIFSYDDRDPLKIDIDVENDKLSEKIQESFKRIKRLMNINRNLYFLVKNSFIDGQIVLHCAYDKKSTKNGIKSIRMIDPVLFYYDTKKEKYTYYKEKDSFYGNTLSDNEEYDFEEIVRDDFSLREGAIILSYIDKAIKPANQLKTLEDLLIPLRFSRSISRRVFNVDIGDLPAKRGKEVMNEHQTKFKYKKFYNADTGEISNQQHITSMVEDYWFANRNGGRGTTVDTLDETGNLGELDDILYFNKKLYRALNVPLSRLKLDPDSDNEFEFDSTRTTKEDMKFFQYISRLRTVYISVMRELLKRELISTGVVSKSEWEKITEDIRLYFTNDNSFIETMNTENFLKKLDVYSTVAEYQGKLFPVEKILKDVFKMSDDEIEENFKMIEKESKDKKYANFYQSDEDGGRW